MSPGFALVRPDQAFRHIAVKENDDDENRDGGGHISHNRYVDTRTPTVALLNRDEAHILYNTALQFKGKKALQFGCGFGWEACHLALGGVHLTVVDERLADQAVNNAVGASLDLEGVLDLVEMRSERGFEQPGGQAPTEKWSLFFLDATSDSDRVLSQARICEQHAEPDAAVLLHGSASLTAMPAIDHFVKTGWSILVYHTDQNLTVAVRGNVRPLVHRPDPRVAWPPLPAHLRELEVGGRGTIN